MCEFRVESDSRGAGTSNSKRKKNLREVLLEENLISANDLDKILDPANMI